MIKELKVLLSDSYITMLQSHNFHWNVKGPLFKSLHDMFQIIYEDLFLAIDEIAERIRSLGEDAPANYKDFLELSKIKDAPTKMKAKDMVQFAIKSNEQIVNTAKKLAELAGEKEDKATEDLAIRRIDFHQKQIWMLKTIIEEE